MVQDLCKIYIKNIGVPVVARWLMNPTRNHEVASLIPRLAQWVRDPALLWLWRRLVATPPIRPLAWEPPCASGAALEKENDTPPKKDLHKKSEISCFIRENFQKFW